MRKPLVATLAVLAAALGAAAALALTTMVGGVFKLKSSTIVPGAGTASGGAFTHSYTIGALQAAPMKGGGLTLTPGPLGAVRGARDTNDAAHAFPIPFEPARGHVALTFTQLSARASIDVYTVSGERVKRLDKFDPTDQYVWTPVANERGERLASGVYIFVVNSPGQKPRRGKIMVIR